MPLIALGVTGLDNLFNVMLLKLALKIVLGYNYSLPSCENFFSSSSSDSSKSSFFGDADGDCDTDYVYIPALFVGFHLKSKSLDPLLYALVCFFFLFLTSGKVDFFLSGY